MVKHAVALKTGPATAEAILKRFNSYNVTHPTYKALAELGKVAKAIYLCEYLSSLELRHEVEAGLNVVERWNEANDFLCYGRQDLGHEQPRTARDHDALPPTPAKLPDAYQYDPAGTDDRPASVAGAV